MSKRDQTMTKKTDSPKITLRGFKTAEWQSQDSTCFEATVLVDGKPFCHASDDGWGGEISYGPVKTGSGRKVYDAIHELGLKINPNAKRTYDELKVEKINATPKKVSDFNDEMYRTASDVTTSQVFDWFVASAVTSALYVRDLKKLMVKKVVWLDNDDNQIYNTRNAPNAAQRDRWIPVVEKKHNCTILNTLPIDEAVAIYAANAS